MPTNTDSRFNFSFPRSKFVDENGICGQLQHVESEVNEAALEIENTSLEPLAMEIMDIYHSAETAVRILAEKYGVDIKLLRDQVIIKNQVRGYYTHELPEAQHPPSAG